MEFPFDLAAICCLSMAAPQYNGEEDALRPLDIGPQIVMIDQSFFHGRHCDELCAAVEALGKSSAIAQGLRKPVTFGTPHLGDQRLYLLVDGRKGLGLLKVGPKRLFVAKPASHLRREHSGVQDALAELCPLCVLDFYVHESCQRNGHGRRLFDAMLSHEGVQASQLAYDRPSPKLLGFLAKHFSLTRFRHQSNNFVIFDDYFECEQRPPVATSHSQCRQLRPSLIPHSRSPIVADSQVVGNRCGSGNSGPNTDADTWRVGCGSVGGMSSSSRTTPTIGMSSAQGRHTSGNGPPMTASSSAVGLTGYCGVGTAGFGQAVGSCAFGAGGTLAPISTPWGTDTNAIAGRSREHQYSGNRGIIPRCGVAAPLPPYASDRTGLADNAGYVSVGRASSRPPNGRSSSLPAGRCASPSATAAAGSRRLTQAGARLVLG